MEYDSVKVIIPNSNSEKITHGIFYTAITRAKKRLKIYWSAETMDKIVKSFSVDETGKPGNCEIKIRNIKFAEYRKNLNTLRQVLLRQDCLRDL